MSNNRWLWVEGCRCFLCLSTYVFTLATFCPFKVISKEEVSSLLCATTARPAWSSPASEHVPLLLANVWHPPLLQVFMKCRLSSEDFFIPYIFYATSPWGPPLYTGPLHTLLPLFLTIYHQLYILLISLIVSSWGQGPQGLSISFFTVKNSTPSTVSAVGQKIFLNAEFMKIQTLKPDIF